jgi:hypothetical protein
MYFKRRGAYRETTGHILVRILKGESFRPLLFGMWCRLVWQKCTIFFRRNLMPGTVKMEAAGHSATFLPEYTASHPTRASLTAAAMRTSKLTRLPSELWPIVSFNFRDLPFRAVTSWISRAPEVTGFTCASVTPREHSQTLCLHTWCLPVLCTRFTQLLDYIQSKTPCLCDFRLTPRCKWGIRSCGMLSSVDW